jgi:putative flavoprotein involved in K+ transport
MHDVVVIGGGHAGLTASHALRTAGIDHVLLERARVGESWRSGRWDSFALNTPGSLSLLPGDEVGPGEPEAFWPRDAFAGYLEEYAARLGTDIREGVDVHRITREEGAFAIETSAEPVRARAVIVAAGTQRAPRLPGFASALPADVVQLHSLDYRNPSSLPAGAVLVVGSAQSGVQIAEDLVDAGRTVFLSTGRSGRMRRRYRGRDSMAWLFRSPWFAQTAADLPDPRMAALPQPQISGIGPHGHSVSLQWLGERGVRLLGHAEGVKGGRLQLRDDLGANIGFGDSVSAQIVQVMEAAIAARGVDAAPPEDDPGDRPHPTPMSVHGPAELDLVKEGIAAVIWTTGVRGDLAFLPPDALASDGRPLHTDGVSPVPGLYHLSIPWMRSRGSGVIAGAAPDANFIVERIKEHLAQSSGP